ncbi:MAG: DUF3179 domain-containing (seleno)protein, partial [Tepidisphaeraceae bacterium]
FINGVTGRDREGKPPAGVREALPVTKTTWARWRATHPQSRVMSPQRTSRRPLPTVAVLPRYPAPPAPGSAVLLPETPVILVGTDPPLVLRGEQVSRDPLNLKAGDVPLLVFRDKTTGAVRAFDRRVEDLTPRFSLNTNAKRAGVAFIDSDTRAGWNTSGAVVDGEKEWRGKRLTLVPVEENLYWGVMKHWYPDLQVWAPPR